jgi:hypothetical protein
MSRTVQGLVQELADDVGHRSFLGGGPGSQHLVLAFSELDLGAHHFASTDYMSDYMMTAIGDFVKSVSSRGQRSRKDDEGLQ